MGILGRNFLHTAVSSFVLKFVVGMVIVVVTGNALEPAGRGEYFLLVLIITTITTVLNFGVPGTNTYFTAQKKFSRAQLTRGLNHPHNSDQRTELRAPVRDVRAAPQLSLPN